MNTEKFWAMIEKARKDSAGNIEKQRELLIESLCDLSVDDIQEFDHILWSMMARAYRSDVWEAAWLVACGCGDDGFHDFRSWLIEQGEVVYEKVLEDPENLADIVDKKERLNIFAGWISNAAALAYERKTQQPIPQSGYSEIPILIGGSVGPVEEIPTKFPRIIDKIGDCDEDELSLLY